jgi:hypothetical protein
LLRASCVLVLILWLQACSTMSANECRQANWRDVGFRDGLAGAPLRQLDRRIKDCAEAGVTIQVPAYLLGRNEGLRRAWDWRARLTKACVLQALMPSFGAAMPWEWTCTERVRSCATWINVAVTWKIVWRMPATTKNAAELAKIYVIWTTPCAVRVTVCARPSGRWNNCAEAAV